VLRSVGLAEQGIVVLASVLVVLVSVLVGALSVLVGALCGIVGALCGIVCSAAEDRDDRRPTTRRPPQSPTRRSGTTRVA